MSIYEEWGFSDTPFATTALEPNELGSKLLVGRELDVGQLSRRLSNPPKLPTVEGANGVGKTSLVNVTTFRAYREHREKSSGPLFIPCRRSFQLAPDTSVDAFVNEVYLEIGQTLYEFYREVLESGKELTVSLERLVTAPIADSIEKSLKSFGRAPRATVEGLPVDTATFSSQVLSWLKEVFPAHKDGGVVCIIDNIELLQTSQVARRVVEQLRDPLLTKPGIRWVLCGASGIIRSVVSSPRMEGLLHDPIELGGMKEEHASAILPSRVSAYASRSDSYLPIVPEDFELLYKLLRANLRAALGYADRYCMWVSDSVLPKANEDKRAKFETWLNRESAEAYGAVSNEMPPRTREVFRKAVAKGGEFSPSDFEEFGFTSSQALRPHVKTLEDLHLVASQQDDVDKRRKTISVTPKGWLVEHAIVRQAGFTAGSI